MGSGLRLAPALVATAGFALWWLEHRRPLRRRVENPSRHSARNIAVAALGAVAVQLAERPLVDPVAAVVERRRWGLLQHRQLPRWLETTLALVLLDYTLYVWHVLVHRSPALWRFHKVHHVDRDLDASTALRFHFGELALSAPWRMAQVAAIGVTPRTLRLWQHALLVSILFHHSNLRLPPRGERLLSTVFMTPRLHGIHHSDRENERDSNWSSGLTVWDWLHGTLRTDINQQAIRVGVEGYQNPEEVTLPRIIAMPFEQDDPRSAIRTPRSGIRTPRSAEGGLRNADCGMRGSTER